MSLPEPAVALTLPPARADVELLLRVLREPAAMGDLDPTQWDLLVRAARRANLLATLHARWARIESTGELPAAPARHLRAAHALYQYRHRMALRLLESLETAIGRHGTSVVLLKGTAYAAQNLAMAQGRIFADVDILVARERLDHTEEQLRLAGWTSTVTDSYDQHYYRHWSHELPPLKHPEHVLTLDVHHTLLPVTGRVRVDASALLRRCEPLSGSPWQVLSAPDQVLHASVHLFQDSDCADHLRDLTDIDGLLREFGARPGFWTELTAAALRWPGMGRSLWYALRYGQAWLHTPVPALALHALQAVAPANIIAAMMDRAIARLLFGPHPDARNRDPAPVWSLAMKTRAMLLRMPPHLLAYHALRKALRAATSH